MKHIEAKPDGYPLGRRAFEHVHFLVEGIGPRPAGSEAEQQAQAYVAEHLTGWGYQVQKQPVAFAPLPRFFPVYLIGGLIMAIIPWFIQAYPGLTIWLPVLLVTVAAYARWAMLRRRCTAQSVNIIANTNAYPDVPTLILCAHLDSARASPFRNHLIRGANYYTIYILQRIAIAVTIISVFRLLGFTLPGWFYIIIGMLGSLAGGWLAFSQSWNQIAHHNDYSPGAHDNASGVGVLLALAEHLIALNAYSSRQLHLGFLFTGAEETGLHGAAEFACQLGANTATSILSLDMVGAGNILHYIAGEGILMPTRTDKKLNAYLREVYPDIKSLWHTVHSGDFARFLRAGIPAAALQTSGSMEAELAYHTVFDTLDVIEIPALDITAKVILKFIELKEKRLTDETQRQ
jgi:hypothetical protein